MSLFVKATCENCKCKFELYSITLQHEKEFRCPHCNQKIEKKQWENMINAFFTTQDMNYQAKKANSERGTALFAFEFVNKTIDQGKIVEE